MKIVSERSIAEFLERKASAGGALRPQPPCGGRVVTGKNSSAAQNAAHAQQSAEKDALISALERICLVCDECEDDYQNAHLDGCASWDEYFLKHAQLKQNYYQAGSFKALSFAQLNALANQAAHFLRARGLVAGDKIGLMLFNSLEFAVGFFACFKAGLILVPINALASEKDLAYICQKTKLKFILGEDKFAPISPVDFCPKSDFLGQISAFCEEFASHASEPSDVAMILFTSGTTSRPKGCLLTHYNLLYASHFTAAQVGHRRGEIFASCMPCWHIDLLATALMPAWRANQRFVLFRRFSARRFWQQLVFHEATYSEVLPKMIELIKLQPAFAREREHKLRLLLYFLNMSDRKYLEFKERFGVDLFTSYGSSETVVGIIGDRHFEDFRFGAIGRVCFGVDAIIADVSAGCVRELPRGQIGQICIKARRGVEIFKGYFEEPECDERAFLDGYFLTGDYGYCDESGLFYFHSRSADLIKINGENISAIELENALCEHPAVQNACIIATCDEISCDLVMAIVQLKNPDKFSFYAPEKGVERAIECEQLSELVRDILRINEGLSAYKKIRHVVVVKALPHNEIGKVQKNILGELYGRV